MVIEGDVLNELALFAGSGGGLLASQLLGWRTVCAVERDAYAAQILAQRQNDGILQPFPIWSEIKTFDGRAWRGIIDIISGGFPCQAFSTAARGRNIANKDLWSEMLRIITEVQPRYVFAENVSRTAIERAADDLESLGYAVRCAKISAADLGADHIRARFWLLAHSDDKSKLRSGVNAKVGKLSQLYSTFWESKPCESRISDGATNRVDRFRAIGNAQVPAVARFAFYFLYTTLICSEGAKELVDTDRSEIKSW